jgi:hypothetical protein
MSKVIIGLTNKLSCGIPKYNNKEKPHGVVETLASVYEKARNAMEYRADNLVRRAAIERILRRRMFLGKDPNTLANNLIMELKWARYVDSGDIPESKRTELASILSKYVSYSGHVVPPEWIAKIASAEIEEFLNLNHDYPLFTLFAFQAIKQKIDLDDPNLELLIYYSVDKIYAASDDEKIAYHIISFAGENIDSGKIEEGWKLFNLAKSNKLIPRINKFVRRQMPPLALIRDIYFYNSTDFKEVVQNKDKFVARTREVLDKQLKQMSGKISTAGVRSIIYVFLTKMVIAFGVEVPLEILIYSHINKIPFMLNIIFPPLLMWIITMQIKLPKESERENLIERTWEIMENFDEMKNESDKLLPQNTKTKNSIAYYIFSIIYGIFFVGVFVAIYYILGLIGFKLFSKLIFIFFLTVIAFFAYRISQISKIYSWKKGGIESSSVLDIIFLPILTIGSWLSQGMSKLNFLAFALDFILEAPFKLILGVVDDWVQFLSIKKEEQTLD